MFGSDRNDLAQDNRGSNVREMDREMYTKCRRSLFFFISKFSETRLNLLYFVHLVCFNDDHSMREESATLIICLHYFSLL